MVKVEKKLYIWYWVGGGYNSCHAINEKEALDAARAMARGTSLKLDEESLHQGTYEELARLDRQYSMD